MAAAAAHVLERWAVRTVKFFLRPVCHATRGRKHLVWARSWECLACANLQLFDPRWWCEPRADRGAQGGSCGSCQYFTSASFAGSASLDRRLCRSGGGALFSFSSQILATQNSDGSSISLESIFMGYGPISPRYLRCLFRLLECLSIFHFCQTLSHYRAAFAFYFFNSFS